MHLLRTKKGFTLVELLVVVLIVGILSAIALPNFIGAHGKSRAAAVKGNMRTAQIAAEGYATDTGGQYGATPGDIQNYAPGGGNTLSGSPGNWPDNPVDSTTIGIDVGSGYADAASVVAARNTVGTGVPGVVYYSGTTDKTSYAVLGYGSDGKQLTDPSGSKALVLSNQ